MNNPTLLPQQPKTGSLSSVPLSKGERVRRKLWQVYYAVWFRVHPYYLVPRLRRIGVAFRSAFAHIRIQSGMNPATAPIPGQLEYRDGCLWMSEAQCACDAGIKTLQAKYPWVDIVDLRIFLEGFEAGERFGISRQSQNPRNLTEPQNL